MPNEPKTPEAAATSADALPTEAVAFSDDGVDLTLIRWYLALPPVERLRQLQGHVRALWSLRRDNPKLRA